MSVFRVEKTKGYMKAMVAAGYVHGRTQGLVPQANITRAEFAQLYFNIIQSYPSIKSGDRVSTVILRTGSPRSSSQY